MDDYDYYDPEFQHFMAEKNAYDRVGRVGDIGMGDAVNLRYGNYSAEEKFKLIARATVNIINDILPYYSDQTLSDRRHLGGSLNFTISTDQISLMLDQATKLPDFQFKNPSAFALGYMIVAGSTSKSGRLDQIDRTVFERVVRAYTESKDQFTTKMENVDILRYARLCIANNIRVS